MSKSVLVGIVFAVGLLVTLILLTLYTIKPDAPQPDIPEKAAMQMARNAALPESSLSVPATLGSLRWTQSIRGAKAIAEIEQLHQTSIEITDGIISQYQANGAKATLWVATAITADKAVELVDLMNDLIRDGHPVFQQWVSREMQGIRVYEVFGMGQKHYYFVHNRQMYWLAVDASVAENALRELLELLK